MTAVMSAESDDTDKIAAAVAECAKMKIKVLPPDVNKSETDFAIEKENKKQAIRFGLSAIKNVGKAAIEAIMSDRQENKDFASLEDFVRRVNLRVVNRKTLESLIKAGAMDSFGKRNAMLKVLDEIKSSGVSLSKTIAEGQGSLFSEKEMKQEASDSISVAAILESTDEAPKEEILSWERDLLGLYLTEHPLEKIASKLEAATSVKISEIEPDTHNKQTIKIGGIIAAMRKTLTKVRQEEMCFIKIQDMTGSQEVIVFPRTYASAKEILVPDQIVILTGRLEVDENSSVLIAENISVFDPQAQSGHESLDPLEVAIPKNADRLLLSKIYQILKSQPGDSPTFLILPGDNGSVRKVQVPFSSDKSFDLEEQLLALGCKILS